MKTIHIVGGLDPANGGPAYSVPRLCDALSGMSVETEILTLTEEERSQSEGTRYFKPTAARVPVLSRLKCSREMKTALRQEAAVSDVIHSHGLWIAPNIYAGQAAATAAQPLIVSPRGMLSPGALQFSTYKKKIIWKTIQERAYRKAAAWHATSDKESEELREFGVTSPIAVIPNGIDLPAQSARHSAEKQLRTILFLSRIHPKKGLPQLLYAWRQLAPQGEDWQLVIAGPDEGGHSAELQGLVRQEAIPRVVFTGPVYGQEKDAMLADADLFVLPTLSENFGISVAEALAAGVPAIVTRGAPWRGLDLNGCGWWIEQGVEPLLAAMRDATSLSAAEREAMGLRGRAWMQRDFAWGAIGREMKDLYFWVTGKGDRPSSVRFT